MHVRSMALCAVLVGGLAIACGGDDDGGGGSGGGSATGGTGGGGTGGGGTGGGGTGGGGTGGGGTGGSAGGGNPADAFCASYEMHCGYGATGHFADEADCLDDFTNKFDTARQACVIQHLANVDSQTSEHCLHAAGAAPCD